MTEIAGICHRCGKPIGYKVYSYGDDGYGEEITEQVSDGYFIEAYPGRRWFHRECDDMKPLKRHLLPWVSAFQ